MVLSRVLLSFAAHPALNDGVSYSVSTSGNPVVGLIGLLVGLFAIVCMWKIFTKAGQPGWAAIVPIYNCVVLCRIAGKPAWWILLFFVPFVNIYAYCAVLGGLSKAFGHGFLFAVGIFFLSPIFLGILAFSSVTPQMSGGYSYPSRAA